MEKSLVIYILTAALICTLFGAVATYAFITPSLDIHISELETTISNLDDRLSVVEEYLTAPFSMQVIPSKPFIMDHMKAIVGQRWVFLVVVADEGLGEGKAVSISAASTFNASVTVNPKTITPGQVAEVTVIPKEVITRPQPEEPEPEQPLYNLTVTIIGARDGQEQTETVTVSVWVGEDGLAPYATGVRDRFIPWLAANHPELGITNETEWNGTIIAPDIVVVSYYLFLSDDWEMGVRWHVTIVPHDYAEIYLRRRFVEVQPSYAFRIDSFQTEPPLDPHVIDPPESLWR